MIEEAKELLNKTFFNRSERLDFLVENGFISRKERTFYAYHDYKDRYIANDYDDYYELEDLIFSEADIDYKELIRKLIEKGELEKLTKKQDKNMEIGVIKKIEEVFDLKVDNSGGVCGESGKRLGLAEAINSVFDYNLFDGYKIETTLKTFYILISNGQNCCEDWGYLTPNDDLNYFIGKEIDRISLTDMNLSNKELKQLAKRLRWLDEGGVQFLTMHMKDGEVLQFAVYNGHNGYYGHSIIIVEDDKILLQDVL